jgi:hypothetical protein
MPYARIATKQALYALSQLHAELAGKPLDSKAESHRLTVAMLQVEAVMKMLAPGFTVATIAVRRKKPNPRFKRGTVYRAALEVLRDAPKTAREIAEAMLAAKGVAGTSYAGFWVTRRSGGVVCRHFDDLDAVFKSDTCDDLRQLICAFQPPPCLRCGA